MDKSLFLIFVLTCVIVGGVLLVLLEKWARKKNASLGKDAAAWRVTPPLYSFAHFFFGTRSSIESWLGKILAWLVILVVFAYLAFASYVFLFFK